MGKLWYLSPSDQTGNTGINGYGTEEAQMNALLDAITPHLARCGVRYHRASRDLGIDYRALRSPTLWGRIITWPFIPTPGAAGRLTVPLPFTMPPEKSWRRN